LYKARDKNIQFLRLDDKKGSSSASHNGRLNTNSFNARLFEDALHAEERYGPDCNRYTGIETADAV